MAATSAPIPIPVTHPTELHTLLSAKQWPAVVERCRTHPHEVGSASHLRSERGYTPLHTLVAYNQLEPVDVLVPVVKAILKAADDVDYGGVYRLGGGGDIKDENEVNTNEIVDGIEGSATQGRRSRGSWRILLDQNNHARWSPLHLACVHGGWTRDNVTMMRALLQMEMQGAEVENDGDATKYQHKILTLLDRQDRSVLHHLLDSVVPSDETGHAVRFVVGRAPELLFGEDVRGKMPLQYVLERITENPGTRRRHYMNSYAGHDDAGLVRNYAMLTLLVGCMEKETRGWDEAKVRKRKDAVDAVPSNDSTDQDHSDTTIRAEATVDEQRPRNILHCACLLPRSVCPSDGSLLTYLSSTDASKLEAKVREESESIVVNMAAESDEDGNNALHIFASNRSYANNGSFFRDKEADPVIATCSRAEYTIMQALLDLDHNAVFLPNNRNELPLHLAMKAGRRRAVALLLLEYPEAVLVGDTVDDVKVFVHILGCISIPRNVLPVEEEINANTNSANKEELAKVRLRCLTVMFDLIRARPNIASLVGGRGPRTEEKQKAKPEKKKWWKTIVPIFC